MSGLPSAFKSTIGERRFMAVYDDWMRRWETPYATASVSSRFGETHVVQTGPADAPPLVLLHGLFGTSAMWVRNIVDLASRFRVYALDVMGQPSRSVPGDSIRKREEYNEWLGDCLDSLGLAHVHLAGVSFGGWLAINFALARPEMVDRVVLFSPAGGLLPVGAKFMLRGMSVAFLPGRFWVRSFFRWITHPDFRHDPEYLRDVGNMAELLYLGMRHFRVQNVLNPAKYSDEELRNLSVPVLILVGRQEKLYNAKKAIARAKNLIPNVRAEVIHRASHDMFINRARLVDEIALRFLESRPD